MMQTSTKSEVERGRKPRRKRGFLHACNIVPRFKRAFCNKIPRTAVEGSKKIVVEKENK